MSAVTIEKDVANTQESTGKKPVAGSITFSVETITPDLAAEYLASSPLRNERLENRKTKKGEIALASDPKIVMNYAEIMTKGGWLNNGMPIIFDPEGHLIDGIARLEAVVMSGATVRITVARNVRSDTLHTIDQHRRRTYTGVLDSRGLNFTGTLQRMMTKLIRIENGVLGKDYTPINWGHFDRVLESNPELMEAASISEGSKGSILHSTPRPVLAFMAIKAGKREQLRFFLAGLKDIDTYPLGNPARMLAAKLKAEQNREKIARENDKTYDGLHIDTVLAISIMAFNDFCEGKTVEEEYFWTPDYGKAKRYRNNRKKVKELAPENLGMPVVDGYPGLEAGKYIAEDSSKVEPFTGERAEELIRANKEKSGEEEYEWRMITPERAQQYLRLNRDNRALSDEHKHMIAKDIMQGNWMLNAQPICFTGDPDAPDAKERGVRMLNGQHRLHAIIEADMAVEVPIAKYIPEEAFSTYDNHSKKLRMENQSGADVRVLSAAARLQWKEDNGIEIFSTGISPTSSEIKSTIEKHPGMADAYPKARTLIHVGSAGIMTYLIYRVTKERPDIAEDFLEGLRTGENLAAKNPILSARTRIVGQRTAKNGPKVTIPRKEVLHTLITSWKDYKTFRDEQFQDEAQKELL